MIADFPLLKQPPGSNACLLSVIRAVNNAILGGNELLPQRLLEFQTYIQNNHQELTHNLNVQPIRYYRETWDKHFGADKNFTALMERYPHQISRGNLRVLSHEAHEDNAQAQKLFLATMLWGYGIRGYGPWRTHKMVTSLEQHSDLLTDTIANLRRGDLLAAYQDFGFRRRLERCGQAFFTKFFYAIGLCLETRPMPLVLDSRVDSSLRKLTQTGEAEYTGDYLEYIQMMDQWAHDLGCRADAIEMFLFDPPSQFYENV